MVFLDVKDNPDGFLSHDLSLRDLRREGLSTASGAAEGGPPSERKDIMGRIIAVNSNCYHGYSIEQAIDGIAAAGFRYIELTATKGWTCLLYTSRCV